MSDVTSNINIEINSSGALAQLKKLETEINSFQRSVSTANSTLAARQEAINRAFVDGINNTGAFNSRIIDVHDNMSRLSTAIDKGKLSLGEYTRYAASQLPGMSRVFRKEFDSMASIAESRVKKLQAQYVALGKTADGVTRAIQSTPTGLGKGYATDLVLATQRQQLFNKMIDDGSTKLLNWGKNTQWAGRQLMVGFSIPLAALGAVASKTFMEIDKATVSLKRVYGDLNTTTKEVETNIAAIKQLGAEYTKYGISLKDTIELSARAAATGATNDKLLAETKQTLRFATLGQIDYNQALDTTVALQSAFGISNEDLGKKIDYLNAVENQTILTMEDMSLAIPRVATVIKGLGGDVEDLAAFMTAMREGGVSAENAANALKSGLASLINPTKAAREALAGLGINIDAIVNANRGDIMATVQAFGQALGTLKDFERQQALEKVFGKYQYARMGALFDNITKSTSQAARAMDVAKMSAQDLANVADKELSTLSESTSVKFQAAMEQLKISIAPLGEAFLKGITPIVNMVTKIADAFNNLPDGVKNAIAVVTAAVAGIGPVLLMTIGLIGNGLANIVKGVQFFRRTLARIRGDADSFKYLSTTELEADAATKALEGSTTSLTGKLSLQRAAVAALTTEYQRFAEVAGIASGAMSGFGGGPGRAGAKSGVRPMPPIRRAQGGLVPGTGNKDTIPALLTPGESVITKSATQKYGPMLEAMNSGKPLPGFAGGGVNLRFLRSLLTTRSGIPGAKAGRADLLGTMSRISSERKLNVSKHNPQFSPTLGAKTGENQGKTFIPDTPIVRGHLAPAEIVGNETHHPGLMFWQGKEANSSLIRKGGVQSQTLLDDFLNLENKGLYPPSLMIAGLEELAKLRGISEARLKQMIKGVDRSYMKIKKGLERHRGNMTDAEFLAFSDKILKNSMDKEAYDLLSSYKTVRTGGKSTRVEGFALGGVGIGLRKMFQGTQSRLMGGMQARKATQARNNTQTMMARHYENMLGITPEEYAKHMRGTYGHLYSNPAELETAIAQNSARLFGENGKTSLARIYSRGKGDSLSPMTRGEFSSASSLRSVDAFTHGLASQMSEISHRKTLEKVYEQMVSSKNKHVRGLSFDDFVNKIKTRGSVGADITGQQINQFAGTLDKSFIKEVNKRYAQNAYGLKGKDKLMMYRAETGGGSAIKMPAVERQGYRSPQQQEQVRQSVIGSGKGSGLGWHSFSEGVAGSFAMGKETPLLSGQIRVRDLPQILNASGYSDEFAMIFSQSSPLSSTVNPAHKARLEQMMKIRKESEALSSANAHIFDLPGDDPRKVALLDELSKLRTQEQSLEKQFAQSNTSRAFSLRDAYQTREIPGSLINTRLEELKRYEKIHGEVTRSVKVGHANENEGILVHDQQNDTYRINLDYLSSSGRKALTQADQNLINMLQDEFGITLIDQKMAGTLKPARLNKGMVPGFGNTDKIPALLTPGESVITKEATAKYAPILQSMNDGTLKMHNTGVTATQGVVQSNEVTYGAPERISRQTKQMEWQTRASENAAARKIAERWNAAASKIDDALNKVAAHIVPEQPGGRTKTWNPRNLIADTQAVNNYMNRAKKISQSMLENQQVLAKISKSTGLSLARVRQELTNFSRGMHPITEASASVLRRVASMDEAASRMALASGRATNVFGAKTETGYLAGMTKGILRERAGTGFYTNRPRYTGPTVITTRPSMTRPSSTARISAPAPQSKQELLKRAQQVRKQNPGMTSQQALHVARQEMGMATPHATAPVPFAPMIPPQSAPIEKPTAKSGFKQRYKNSRFIKSMGGGRGMGLSMALGMASMAPMMMQNKEGKVMGMDANTLSMGMMGASMLPMLAPLISNPYVAAVGLAAAAVGAGLYLWRKNIDDTSKETASLGANLGVTANAVGTMGKVMGVATPAERYMMKNVGATQKEAAAAQQIAPQLQSEAGQKFLTDLKAVTPEKQAKQLSDYLNAAIATRMMDKTTANAFAKSVAAELGNPAIASQAIKGIMKQGVGSKAMMGLAQQRMDAANKNALIRAAMNAGPNDKIGVAAAGATIGSSMQILSDLNTVIAQARDEYANGTITFQEYDKTIKEAMAAQKEYNDLLFKVSTQAQDKGGVAQAVDAQLVAAGYNPDQIDVLSHAGDIGIQKEPGLLGAIPVFGQMVAAATLDWGGFTDWMRGPVGVDKAGSDYQRNYMANEMGKKGYQDVFDFAAADPEAYTKALTDARAAEQSVIKANENGWLNSLKYAVQSKEISIEGATAFQSAVAAGDKDAIAALETFNKTKDVVTSIWAYTQKASGKSQDFIDVGINFKQQGGDIQAYEAFMASIPKEKETTIFTNFKNLNYRQQTQELKDYQDLLNSVGQEAQAGIQSSTFYQNALKTGQTGVVTRGAEKAAKAGVGEAYGNVISDILTYDNGKPITSTEFAKRSNTVIKALEKFKKGDKVDKKKAIIQLITQQEDANGNLITGEKANKAYQDLVDKYGEAKIMNLPEDTITKVIRFRVEISDLDQQIIDLYSKLNATKDPESRIEILKQISKKEGERSSKIAEEGRAINETPSPPTGGADGSGAGGGGGTKEKTFMQQLLDQFKLFVDATATMKKINNAKKNFVNEIMKGQGLLDKVNAIQGVGANPVLMDYLTGLDPKQLQDWIKKNTAGGKGTKLNQQGRIQSRRASELNLGQVMTQARQERTNTRTQMLTANQLSGMQGVNAELNAFISGDANKAAAFQEVRRSKNKKAMQEFLSLQREQMNASKDLADAQNPLQAKLDRLNLVHKLQLRYFDRQTQALDNQIKPYQKQIDALDRLNEKDNIRIRGLNRQKELLQRTIDDYARQNELDQRSIDSLRREDELRNRVADALSHDLDILSKQENAVKDAYQKRIDALNKVAEINQHIIEQQRQQLNLSQALSQGDIYAAAGAALESRQSNAAFAAQQQQAGLQRGQENAVAGLRTAGGLTRDQAEQQIANIKEQSYQTSLQIQVIEDRMYDRNLAMTDLKDQQYKIDNDILAIQDKIYSRESDIIKIQQDSIQPLEDQKTKIQDQVDALNEKYDNTVGDMELALEIDALTDQQRESVNALAKEYEGVNEQLAEMNKLLSDSKKTTVDVRVKKIEEIKKKITSATVDKYKKISDGRTKDAEVAGAIYGAGGPSGAGPSGARPSGSLYGPGSPMAGSSPSTGLQASSGSLTRPPGSAGQWQLPSDSWGHNAAGGIIPSIYGQGKGDNTPIKATPGEFMIRKSAVAKYGSSMLQQINDGTYQIPKGPKYKVPTNIGIDPVRGTNKDVVPVYNNNTYGINVNVAGTNASADEIANRTISKIKEMKNVTIRGARG